MLRVIGRRADGYHELQTVFQFIDRCDWIDFSIRPDGRVLRTTDLPGVAPEEDLVVRAARLLQDHTGCALGAEIRLDKRLPMGGGLGGGSSDAATVLVALNRLWETGVAEDELARLGLRLGADVPVFIQGRAAWAEGVGERLTWLELPEPWYVVLAPPVAVSTGAVFADPQLTRNSPPLKIRDFLAGTDTNDCLTLVRRRYPEVGDALGWLGQFASARLTGTGACVFASFEDEPTAREVLDRASTRFPGFVARGLNRSPLLQRATA